MSSKRIVLFVVVGFVAVVTVVAVILLAGGTWSGSNETFYSPSPARTSSSASQYPPSSASSYPLFIINLDRRPERLHETVQLLKAKGYDTNKMTRLRATDGAAEWENIKTLVLPEALEPIYAGYRTDHKQLSRGAVGCYLSHLKLWSYLIKDAAASTYEGIIVFEDDTYPTLTRDELNKRLKHVPADWDIVLFGATYKGCRDINEYVCRINRFYGTHACLISKRAAQFLVPRALPIEQQIDSWLSDLSEKDEIKIYALRNSAWDQNTKVNSTDIQTPMIGFDD